MTAPVPEQHGPTTLDAAFPMTRWAWLRTHVRKELESRPDAVAVTLPTSGLSTEEHDVLRWLLRLGNIPPTKLRIVLARLDRALAERTDAGLGTRDLLAHVRVGVRERPAERVRRSRDRRNRSRARVRALYRTQRWSRQCSSSSAG